MMETEGYDKVHEVDISGEPFFQEAMKGENYMSSPYVVGDDIGNGYTVFIQNIGFAFLTNLDFFHDGL